MRTHWCPTPSSYYESRMRDACDAVLYYFPRMCRSPMTAAEIARGKPDVLNRWENRFLWPILGLRKLHFPTNHPWVE
jgi:hypothetical protein